MDVRIKSNLYDVGDTRRNEEKKWNRPTAKPTQSSTAGRQEQQQHWLREAEKTVLIPYRFSNDLATTHRTDGSRKIIKFSFLGWIRKRVRIFFATRDGDEERESRSLLNSESGSTLSFLFLKSNRGSRGSNKNYATNDGRLWGKDNAVHQLDYKLDKQSKLEPDIRNVIHK